MRVKARKAFSIIELIFVIIILSSLAVVVIPKLAATRDDARLAADVSNMSRCITDVGTSYIARNTNNLQNVGSNACNAVVCYTIIYNSGVLDVVANSGGAVFCSDIVNVGGHLVKTYEFKGTRVSI